MFTLIRSWINSTLPYTRINIASSWILYSFCDKEDSFVVWFYRLELNFGMRKWPMILLKDDSMALLSTGESWMEKVPWIINEVLAAYSWMNSAFLSILLRYFFLQELLCLIKLVQVVTHLLFASVWKRTILTMFEVLVTKGSSKSLKYPSWLILYDSLSFVYW